MAPESIVREWEGILKGLQTAQTVFRSPMKSRGRSWGLALLGRKGYLGVLNRYGRPPESFRHQNTRIPKHLRQPKPIQVQHGNDQLVENDELT